MPFLGFFLGYLALTPSTSASFTDVPESHPYFRAITTLQDKGVLVGYPDGSYRPDQSISRAEALVVILKGSSIAVEEKIAEDPFQDVGASTWYAPYIQKAKDIGIISGDSATGIFRPGDTVRLAEELKMLLEANQRKVSPPSANPYLDVPKDAWFAPYFAYAKSLAMFPQTSRENIEPARALTRGLMADLMYQLMVYQEGKASFYGLNVQGNGTASGERFNAYALTAAHPSLPFGTMVKVVNLDNQKEVIVKINDRGPYADGRIIDLSQAAFQTIAPLSQGIARVSIIPVDTTTQIASK